MHFNDVQKHYFPIRRTIYISKYNIYFPVMSSQGRRVLIFGRTYKGICSQRDDGGEGAGGGAQPPFRYKIFMQSVNSIQHVL